MTSQAAIIFPPVVTTNYGRYYPSLAALAAWLHEEGIDAMQLDLNQRLLERLLDRECLEASAGDSSSVLGSDGSSDHNAGEASLKHVLASRVLLARPDWFFDERGRARQAGQKLAPVPLLDALVAPYYWDASVSELTTPTFWRDRRVARLEEFYRQEGHPDQLPGTVRTVGISVPMGPQLVPALVLARLLADSGRPVVLGGPTLTLLSRPAIRSILRSHPAVTAVVQNQGELALERLIRHLGESGDAEPFAVEGVLALDGQGRLRGGSGVVPLPKLQDLPFGRYDPDLLARLSVPEVSVRQAEGCYWGKCAYCDYVELYPEHAGQYRPQPVIRLVDEMVHHFETIGVGDFCLITEALPPRVARDMSHEILARGLKVGWNSFAMVDGRFDRETLQAMKAAGCRFLIIGVETMTDRVLDVVQKHATKAMTTEFFSECRSAGIRLVINLIPNLPTTTYEESIESLELVKGFSDVFDSVSIFPFEATQSSAIGRDPAWFGLQVTQDVPSSGSGQAEFQANHLAVIDPAMTAEELEGTIAEHMRFQSQFLEEGRKEASGEKIPFDPTGGSIHFRHEAAEVMIPASQDEAIGPVVFAWASGQLINFPPLWCGIMSAFVGQTEITAENFIALVGDVTESGAEERELLSAYVYDRMSQRGLVYQA